MTPRACVYCERIRMQQWDHVMSNMCAFTPSNPIVPGHVIVAPFAHVDPTSDFMPSFFGSLASYAAVVASVLKIKSANFVVSFGPEAGMSVPHLSIHIIPRKKRDGIQMPWNRDPKDDHSEEPE